MRAQRDRQALVFEMHVLLGPLTLLVGVALMPAVLLGVPHGIAFVATPLLRRNPHELALLAGVVSALFLLMAAWSLGTATLRRERYAFGHGFWSALHATLLSAALIGLYADPRAVALFVPLWVFLAHMGLLQRRLHARPAG